MIRRFKVGFDVELHKRTLERGLLSLIGPEAARLAGVLGLGEEEHANATVALDGVDGAGDPHRRRRGPAVRRAPTTAALANALRAPRRGPIASRRPSACAIERGPAPLRHRPRRQRDPAGGGAQRARRQLHQGLLRGPGDRGAAALQGQAQPPPARPEAVAAAAGRDRAAARRAARGPASAASTVSPAWGRSRWPWCAARPSPGAARGCRRARHGQRCSSCRSRAPAVSSAAAPLRRRGRSAGPAPDVPAWQRERRETPAATPG